MRRRRPNDPALHTSEEDEDERPIEETIQSITDLPSAKEMYQDPAELIEFDHPHRDAFLTEIRRLEDFIMAKRAPLGHKNAQALDLVAQGYNYTKAAEEVGLSPTTVSKAAKSKHGLDFLYARQLLSLRKRGPTLELRKNMLWRIACRNEESRPQLSIAAIKQLDHEEGIGQLSAIPQSSGITINIQSFTPQEDKKVTDMKDRLEKRQNEKPPIEGEFKPITVEVDQHR